MCPRAALSHLRPDPGDATSTGPAVPASTGGLDDEHVAGPDLHRVSPADLLDGAVGALDPLATEGSGLAAGHAVRRDPAMAAEQGERHRREETQPASPTTAAAVPARPTAAAPDLVALEPHGEAPLENLGVGQPGVRHVRLHDVGAVEAWPGAGAAGHGLVVLVTVVAEGQVVHRARTLGLRPERGVQGSGHGLRGLDVARDDRGGVAGRE